MFTSKKHSQYVVTLIRQSKNISSKQCNVQTSTADIRNSNYHVNMAVYEMNVVQAVVNMLIVLLMAPCGRQLIIWTIMSLLM